MALVAIDLRGCERTRAKYPKISFETIRTTQSRETAETLRVLAIALAAPRQNFRDSRPLGRCDGRAGKHFGFDRLDIIGAIDTERAA